MAISKLSNTYAKNQKLKAQDMTDTTEKVNELVDGVNTNTGKVADLELQVSDLGESLAYGVAHYYQESSPTLTRVGNMYHHRTLPVQSLMRRCLVRDNGTVNYYLDANDSTKKADGTDAVLDGADGQVMVEIPTHYRRCRVVEGARPYYEVMVSRSPFVGALEVEKMYVSAYEATLDRTNSKLSSVVNTTAQYRGGNNTSSWDGTYRSLLGLPVTSVSLTNFRQYALNRGTGWYCYDWEAHNAISWLFYIEYATLNCQLAVNNTLTNEGYHHGGLGNGISNFNDQNPKWDVYNGYNPVCPCGHTNSLGNKSGEVQLLTYESDEKKAEGTARQTNLYACSYRGIENPFGHIWKWTDGFIAIGNGTNQEYYMCRNRKYSSSKTSDYISVGMSAGYNNYVKSIVKNSYGDLLATEIGGGSSTYFCDYHYESFASGSVYGSLVGGFANNGASDGLACVFSHYGPAGAETNVGSRLVGHF